MCIVNTRTYGIIIILQWNVWLFKLFIPAGIIWMEEGDVMGE